MQRVINTNYNLRSNFVYRNDELKQIIHNKTILKIIHHKAKNGEESKKLIEEVVAKVLIWPQINYFVLS